MENKIPKILFIARDDGGCGFFRCRQPAAFLKRSGLADTKVLQNLAKPEDILWADLVVFQEMGSVEDCNMLEFCTKNKIPTIVEFDDFIQHVSPHNQAGYGAWNPSTLYPFRAMEMAKKATALTVSSNQLAREYFPYNDTIYVVPNYLDRDIWDNPIPKIKDGKIRIGWMGGNAHADDLKMIADVLEKIVKENNGKVIFETMGMLHQELPNVFNMKTFNDTCPKCGYEGEIHNYPGEALQDYPSVLMSKSWDIAVAPVINTSFNNCKSDIKIKEYSAARVPIIASPITPYLEAAKDNAQILFANTFDEWYNSINDLIKDSDKRDLIIRQNKAWVDKQWIQDNIKNIFEVYSQVIVKGELILGKKDN